MPRPRKKQEFVSEDSDFGLPGKPHPLLISLVVFKILQYVSYSDLKKLRCVCTQWEYEASCLLRSKTLIRLAREYNIKQYMKELPNINHSCVSFEFGNETFVKSQVMQKFFSLYGNDIKSLKLHTAAWSNWELWDLISEKLPNLQDLSLRIFIPKYGHLFPDPEKKPVLPNIKKLNLSFCIEQPDVYFTNPIILKELFLALPNLEVLSCPNWPTIIPPTTTVSTLVFNVILSEPEIKFNNLHYLLITANLSDSEIYSLFSKKFPLKELRLEISSNVKGIYFMCLLLSIATTLETLSLIFPYYYEICQFETFPKLKKLKLLQLHKFQGSLESIVQNCTGLKKLVLNDVTLREVWGENNYDEVNRDNFNGNGKSKRDRDKIQSDHWLEELNIQDKNDSPIGHIKEFVKLFPHLKRLTMHNVNDTVLRTIFAKLPELEEFTAQGNFTDSGVTGFPGEICKSLLHKENTISSEKADQLRTYNYVGNLSKLKRLVLESNLITYVSIVYGVRECKCLEFKRLTSNFLQKLPTSQSHQTT